MTLLIVGLALFLGAHSLRIFADGWRTSVINRLGAGPWKGLYTLVSLTGLVLIVYGYGAARDSAPLYALPHGLTHVTFGLVWIGFICVTAANWPGNHIKQWLGDPMVFGVGLWALGHLLAKATPGAIVLFGGFLAWAIADFISLRQRGATAPAVAPKPLNTILVVIVGTGIAAVFAHVLHVILIGVSPFG